MGADPIIYCLKNLTDYDQFERLCHDLMALDGYRGIEPLGGSKDKGRDAIHIDQTSNNQVTIFAYSVREDWRKKLAQDSERPDGATHSLEPGKHGWPPVSLSRFPRGGKAGRRLT